MNRAVLRAASLLVPSASRADWLAEWRAELWQVSRSRGRCQAIAFTLGAFPDAFWMRRNAPAAPLAWSPASALHCIVWLAALAALTFLGGRRLPSVRIVPGMVEISSGRRPPTVTYDAYRSIADHAARPFSGLAFWQAVRARVEIAPGRAPDLSVALATPSLAGLLGVPAPLAGPTVLLSDRAWGAWFANDPAIAGRLIEVAGRPARIAGMMPSGAWPLPVNIDLWLLDAEPPPVHARGFVLAKVKAPPEPGRRWWISAPNRGGGWDRFECVSLDSHPPFLAGAAMLLLAVLLLPLCTSLRLGEYPATRHSPRGLIRLRRWGFLGLKLALLVSAVYWGTLLVGALVAPDMQPHSFLIGYLLAFRWALIDQRRRCPVCLRLLTNPTPIGWSSRTFLEWYGTELICAKGHGLLHVPEIETSCYSSQRWLYLDRSWSSLFS